MRKAIWTVLITVVALGAGVASASAQSFTLTASLSGNNETPAPGLNTGAFGSATVTVDMTARTITYRVDVFNLPSGATASHIHAGAPGTAGPVIINFAPPINASNDFGFSGTLTETAFVARPDQGIRSFDDALQAILGNNTYVNVHSAVNAGGEVRGQLLLRQ